MDVKYMNRPLDIAIDFDGTITKENSYPEIGELKPNCVDVLKKLKAQGHRLILWTCRNGEKLKEATDFMAAQGVVFDSVNKSIWNPGTLSVKVCAHLYIDDAAYPFVAKDLNFWSTLGKEFGLEGYTD